MFEEIQQEIESQENNNKIKMNIKTFHDHLGHPSEETTRKMAKYYNVQLTGNLGNC